MSMFQSKKPYSAVTVTVENLTSEAYEEDDLSGIPDLVEVITLQSSGPTEAARAIRKKLKYGNAHRQIRALVLLDGLIENAGERFQRTFVDEMLLERLRVCGSSDLSDPQVKKKCRELFRSWAQYSKQPGMESLSRLHKELPKRKQVVTQERSKVLQETEQNPFGDDEEEAEAALAAEKKAAAEANAASSAAASSKPAHAKTPSTSGGFFSSSSKDKKKSKSKSGARKPFNLEAEKEQMKSVIAESSIASTGLMNALQSINRERERISENQAAVTSFDQCKQLRRRVLRYIHHVEHEQWLGGLLHANDELVHALMTYEQLDRSIDADSDSDDEIAEQAHAYRMASMKGKEAGDSSPPSSSTPDLSGLHIDSRSSRTGAPKLPSGPPPVPTAAPAPPQPPRPVAPARDLESESEPEDDDDPFGDSNVVETPAVEKGQPTWGR